jgi:plastocyanin
MKRTTLAALGAGLLLTVVALAGCGGSSSSASETTTDETTTAAGGVETTLELAADPTGQLEFDKTTLEAPAGSVTIVLTNDSSVPHNVAIEGNGVEVTSDTISNGETTKVTADLKPGTYTFECTIPGHEEAGMKGTLTVT